MPVTVRQKLKHQGTPAGASRSIGGGVPQTNRNVTVLFRNHVVSQNKSRLGSFSRIWSCLNVLHQLILAMTGYANPTVCKSILCEARWESNFAAVPLVLTESSYLGLVCVRSSASVKHCSMNNAIWARCQSGAQRIAKPEWPS